MYESTCYVVKNRQLIPELNLHFFLSRSNEVKFLGIISLNYLVGARQRNINKSTVYELFASSFKILVSLGDPLVLPKTCG